MIYTSFDTKVLPGKSLVSFLVLLVLSTALKAQEPTIQASSLTVSDLGSGSLTLSWTRGDGQAVVVLAKEASVVDADPVDNTSYVSGRFGLGDQIGTGNFVVYSGTGTSASIRDLTSSTSYHFAVYEFNTGGSPSDPDYLLSSPPTTSVSTSSPLTLYSFQSGDAEQASTWTTNSSGATLVNPAIPGPEDAAIILLNRTVTITENDFDLASLELNANSTFDLAGTNGHTFTTLSGTGLMRSSADFPSNTTNSFTSASGGTFEYYNTGSITLDVSDQSDYNNLIFDNADITIGQDLTVAGDFTLENNSDMIIGDDATVRNITWSGDVVIDATSSVSVREGTVLTEHAVEVGGDFTNSGSVRFTAQLTPDYTTDPSVGTAIVTFTGASDNTLTCNGITDFYRLIVDKGSDRTFLLTVNSSNVANFALFGTTNDNNTNSDNPPDVEKALWTRNGTLKLNSNVSILSLTEGSKHFYIPSSAGLWVDGASVAMSLGSSSGASQGAAVYGLLRLSSGTITGGDGPGINYRDNAEILIEGGVMTTAQFRRANSGSANNKASYTQTGGTVTFDGVGRNNNGVARFDMESTDLTEAQSSFTMTDGTLIVSNPNINRGGISIQTRAQDFSVTGGTIIAEVTGADNFGITLPGPLYDLILREDVDGATGDIRPMNDGIDLTNLEVQNDLILNTNVSLFMDNDSLTVGGDLTINTGTTYTPGTNATQFNGAGAQTLTIEGTVVSDFNNVVINKSGGTLAISASSPATITINDQLVLSAGTLDDGGKTIAVAGNILNSATHIGSGSISLNGTNTQTISGDGSGIFQNISFFNTNVAAAPVSTLANITVEGTLSFLNDKLLDIATNSLAFGASGVTSGHSATRYIQTNGIASDAGVTKTFDSNEVAYVIPIGTGGAYLPATYTITTSTFGSIAVRPVLTDHPILGLANTGVGAYWSVSQSGWAVPTVTHTYQYPANGSDGAYNVGRYISPSWTDLGDAASPGEVIEGSDQFTISNVNYFEGDFTAADAFSDPITYFARADGDWGTPATWSTSGHGGVAAIGTPAAQDVVLIGDGDTNNYTVTAEADTKSAAAVTIASGSVLNLASTISHTFSELEGTGTLRISSANFPAGDASAFLGPSGGTTEYFDGAANYTIPDLTVATYYNLTINTNGNHRITTPNQSITIHNDLVIGAGSNSGRAQTSINASSGDITINGDLTVQSGGFLRIREGASAINRDITILGDLNVEGDIRMNNGAASTGLILTIYGNLVNNGSLDLAGTISFVSTIFKSSAATTISGTGGTTEFYSVEVDKGTSASSILEVTSDNFTLVGDPGIILTNGTFRLTTATTITASSTSFTIPSTTSLSVNGGTVNMATAAADANDLTLNGELEILSGSVNLGTDGNVNNNDIEYASVGSPTIDIQSGSLFVNGQIRRSAVNTNGSLIYSQSGGDVTISGQNALLSRGKLEIANSGSFNMSGSSTLTLVRGGGTTFDDLHLRPASSTVSGGTIIFAPGTNGSQSYTVDSNIALNNLIITGNGAGNSATVVLDVFGLTLNESMTLTEANSVFNTNNLDMSIAGDFINNGTYTAGTNTTTFNGSAAQLATFNTSTSFNNLTVNKASGILTLAGSTNPIVDNDLIISGGTLEDGGRTINVAGSVTNNAIHTSMTLGVGGISLSDADHTITGTGTFGNITLNGTGRTTTVSNDLMINGDLDFVGTVVLDIANHSLTFSEVATITGSAFSASKMIRVSSNNGMTKNYPASAADFTFPVGIGADYTPVSANLTTNTATGAITLSLFDEAHPLTTDAGATELLYYYRLASSGLSGVVADLIFNYVEADVQGTEGSYFGGRVTGGVWTPVGGEASLINTINNTITYSAVSFTEGDFTAGETAEFGTPDIYYSRNSTAGAGGDTWGNASAWTFNSDGTDSGPLPASAPAGNSVTILTGHTVDIATNTKNTFELVLDGTLNLGTSVNHTFGNITGTGELSLEATVSNNFNFPSADISTFSGAVNYTGSTNDGNLINTPDSFSELTFSGTSIKDLDNASFLITGTWNLSSGTVNQSNNTLSTLSGDFNNTGAIFNASNGTMVLNGTGTQNITTTAGSSSFNNLSISNTSGTVNLQNNITVNGAFTQDASTTLNLSDNVISGTGNVSINGNLSTSNPDGLSGGGATSFASTLSSVTLASGSAIAYSANGNQTISARTDYTDLEIGGASGTKTIAGNTTVEGVLNITAGDLAIGANLLTLNGTVSGAGTITGGADADISVGGTGALGTINFTTGAEELGDFTINRTSSGTVDFAEDFAIRDNLNLTDGKVELGVGVRVTLGTSGDVINITGGSPTSYLSTDPIDDDIFDEDIGVQVFLDNTTLTIPLGFNPLFPVALSCTGCDGTQSFFGQVTRGPYNTPPTGGGRVIDDVVSGQWTIWQASGTTPTTLDIRLGWSASEEDNTLGNNVGITIFDTNITPASSRFWDVGDNIAPKTGSDPFFRNREVTFTGFQPIYFAITNDISPLPITLLSFTGSLSSERQVNLNWQTAQETNNSHFIVERSLDQAESFEEIGFVAGNGNAVELIDYNFTDEVIPDLNGFVYYRLKQVDFNGEFEYSPIVSVAIDKLDNVKTKSWKIYPNPTDGTHLELTLIDPAISTRSSFSFSIVDIEGQVRYTTNAGFEVGRNWVKRKFEVLPSGMYFIVIDSQQKVDRLKVIKR